MPSGRCIELIFNPIFACKDLIDLSLFKICFHCSNVSQLYCTIVIVGVLPPQKNRVWATASFSPCIVQIRLNYISFIQLNSANISGISFNCTTFDLAQFDELYSSLVVYDTITSTISALNDKLTVPRVGNSTACCWVKEHNILHDCTYLQ